MYLGIAITAADIASRVEQDSVKACTSETDDHSESASWSVDVIARRAHHKPGVVLGAGSPPLEGAVASLLYNSSTAKRSSQSRETAAPIYGIVLRDAPGMRELEIGTRMPSWLQSCDSAARQKAEGVQRLNDTKG